MAQVDPNIALSIRPVQIPLEESPLNRMRGYAEYENALLKSQEYQRDIQDRNELAKLLSGPNVDLGSPDFMRQVLTRAPRQAKTVLELAGAQEAIAKRRLEEQKIAVETAQKNRDQIKASAQELASYTSFDDALRAIDRNVGSGLLTEVQGAALKAELPSDPAAFPAWQKQKLTSYLTIEQQLSRAEPKPERVDIGGAIKNIDTNVNSATYGQEVGFKSIAKTPAPVAPSKVVQLQGELDTAIKTYGANSPQVKQIQDKIEQETGGLERKRIEIDRYRSRKGEGGGTGDGGPPTKLEKGERWNAAEGRIETVPGSKLHVAQSDKHNKDREALKGVETKTQSAISKIDELLSPKYIDGFRANFSGDIPFSGAVTQYFAPDARRRIDSLKSDMKAAGLELIRVGGSIGAMTQQEWPIVEQMIAALTPDMTAQEAETQVKKIRAYMEKIKSNAKDAYQTEWGDTQYFKPTGKPSGGAPANRPPLNEIFGAKK
jgi:hypothetical protein